MVPPTAPRPGARRPRPLLLALGSLAALAWHLAGPCWSSAASRRGALSAAAAALLAGASEADAFPNAVRQFKRDANDPKRPGPVADDLGLLERFAQPEPALKECENAPNCFTTTANDVDVGFHDLKPWQYSKSPAEALKDVVEVVEAYQPGQQGIDGGGFSIRESSDRFVYVQFESLRRGHIDDVEFYLSPGSKAEDKSGGLLVRSSSRSGFYDFGVNAMRLNALIDGLKAKGGWDMKKIDRKTHPRYWTFNCDGGNSRKAPFNVADRWPEMCPAPEPAPEVPL